MIVSILYVALLLIVSLLIWDIANKVINLFKHSKEAIDNKKIEELEKAINSLYFNSGMKRK